MKIRELMENVKKPLPIIPDIIVACSCIKRPGLSSALSFANVVNKYAQIGIPTEDNEDGTPNMTLLQTKAILDEVYRAIKEDMRVQVNTMPSTMKIVGTSATGGAVTATNADFGRAFGCGI